MKTPYAMPGFPLPESSERVERSGGALLRKQFRIAWVLVTVFMLASISLVRGQQFMWSNFAGTDGGRGFTDGTGSAARFAPSYGVAVDGSGNVYAADKDNHTIRKITSAGVVTTLAGSPGSSGSTNGTGSAARFNNPWGVAVDGSGNVYVADTFNSTIRKITSAGVVTTLAGIAGLTGSTDGTGSAARFNNPYGVAVDDSGNVYVADTENQTIRKITSAGVVTTLAGTAGSSGSTDDTGSAARFNTPRSVAVDGSDNVYVADWGNYIIRKITSAGVVTTLAGSAGLTGSTDGTGTAARFRNPWGVAVDASGNLFVTDQSNHTIRKITSAGVVATLAGSAGLNGTTNGTGSSARFTFPSGVAVDGSGNVYVADSANDTIRKITSAGVVTTLAGKTGLGGSTNGTGSAARFSNPQGIAVDGNGNVYVADWGNYIIRKITSAGVVTTLAGTGATGSTDGTGSTARFNTPRSVAVDGSGNVYVADTGNSTIRMITSAGVVTTLAGTAGSNGSTDGTGSAARFATPYGVAVDGSGNVYVADYGNSTIRIITSAGVVTTLAGTAGSTGSTNGTGSAARFNNPSGVAVDGSGNVYVADYGNQTIRKITSAGIVTTLGGRVGAFGNHGGLGPLAGFYGPQGIAATASGTVFVANTVASAILKGSDISTETPTLNAPMSSTTPSNPVNVTFILPETASTETVTLSFIGTVTRVLTLASSQETTGTHSFAFNPANPTASAGIASGTPIPDGTYTVTLSYQDTAGNAAATASATAVLLDTTGPTLILPGNLTMEATSASGAVVTYSTSVSDAGSGVATSSITPVSGSTFGLGITTVNASATDNAGNTATGSFTVTVQDTTAPVVVPPANVMVHATSPSGATATYGSASATDAVGVVSLTYSPASGSTFPVNATTVTVTAKDAANNTGTATFTVTVTPLSSSEGWRYTKFGTATGTGNAADDADPNGNGILNILEYALNGSPADSSTGTGILPQASLSGANHLQLTFSRYLDRDDITLIVQGADLPGGPWTDLAGSTAGGAFTVIITGATVQETGTGNTRVVTIGDLYLVSDPAHPRRFMRLIATRP